MTMTEVEDIRLTHCDAAGAFVEHCIITFVLLTRVLAVLVQRVDPRSYSMCIYVTRRARNHVTDDSITVP